MITVWNNSSTHAVRIYQISDDTENGSADEQIAHVGSLEFYAGYQCVSPNYVGSVPDCPAELWRWDGSNVVALLP